MSWKSFGICLRIFRARILGEKVVSLCFCYLQDSKLCVFISESKSDPLDYLGKVLSVLAHFVGGAFRAKQVVGLRPCYLQDSNLRVFTSEPKSDPLDHSGKVTVELEFWRIWANTLGLAPLLPAGFEPARFHIRT